MARRFLLAIRGQVLRLDHPWRAPAQLAPWKDAALNHAQRRHDAHSHTLRCSFKRDLSPLDPFTFAIDGNTMVTAERADPCFSPALAASSHLQLQRGVVSALPMQDHLDEATFDAHDDLVQCGAEDPFTGFCCRGRVRPSELEIDTEPHQLPPLSLSQRGRLFRLQLGNLALETMYDLQCLIPAALELASHQSVGGINSIILPPGIRRRELCLLQRQLELPLCG